MRPADLVFVNGTVLTGDPARPVAAAVATTGPRIVALSDDALALTSGAEVFDLRGATVTTGLVDSHTHPTLALDSVRGVDLTGCVDLTAVRDRLTAHAHQADDEWIIGWGLDPNAFGSSVLTAEVVDAAAGGRPALVHLFDGHSALASREALHRAGITGARRFVSSATIPVDADGRPTGLLVEPEAVDLVREIIPAEGDDQRLERLAAVLAAMAATGLTGGHVMDCHGDTLDLLAALEASDRLPLRLRIAPWCSPGDDVAALLDGQGRHGRLWEVAGVKLFLDGTIDGGTAWLHEPDRDGCSTGPYWPDPARYAEAVQSLHAAGVPTATHAIGDAAVEFVLDTLATLPPGPRHRIEHLETLPDDQIPRFARLGVVASMQPTHATDYTRADHSDNWSSRLGPERADRGWRCADILRTGAVVTLGSDWPVAPYDPRAVMAAARLRRPAHRPDLDPVGVAQVLTAADALTGYTAAPAWAAGVEDVAGRIAVGRRADLTVWAGNPLQCAAEDLPELPVLASVVDGVIRHRAG